jgi:hypothetical protein
MSKYYERSDGLRVRDKRSLDSGTTKQNEELPAHASNVLRYLRIIQPNNMKANKVLKGKNLRIRM